jgi:hypothetical protein
MAYTRTNDYKKQKEMMKLSDADFRRAMLRQRNPAITIPEAGSSTIGLLNTINPLTLREYSDSPKAYKPKQATEYDLSSEIFSQGTDSKYKYNKGDKDACSIFKLIYGPSANEVIERQKAIGLMAVRNGQLKQSEYERFLTDCTKLAIHYERQGFTLDSITDVGGLEKAIRKMDEDDDRAGDDHNRCSKTDPVIKNCFKDLTERDDIVKKEKYLRNELYKKPVARYDLN